MPAASGRYLFARTLGNIGSRRGVLHGDRANVSILINVEHSLLVEIKGRGDGQIPELDQQGVGVGKVSNLHGLNPRSKKALRNVTPAGMARALSVDFFPAEILPVRQVEHLFVIGGVAISVNDWEGVQIVVLSDPVHFPAAGTVSGAITTSEPAVALF